MSTPIAYRVGIRQVLVGQSDQSLARSRLQKPTALAVSSGTTSLWRAVTSSVLGALTFLAIALVAFLVGPELYFRIFPTSVTREQVWAQDMSVPSSPVPTVAPELTRYLPPQVETLPEGEWLIIPRIGVNTQLQATEYPDEALATGVWHVPDFGQPGNTELPMIAAAHRYGWQWWWQDEYWKYHSFYLLPELEPGDRIEIIADQRKWVYEIYGAEEGEDITDYSADLILYTCKFLNSPVRHFRYANLVTQTDGQWVAE